MPTARVKFQPVIRRARYKVAGYTGAEMLEFGNVLAEDVKARILRAENVQDQPAIPLRPNYAKYKAKKAPPAVRNWRLSGRTLRGLRCVSASPNLAIIRFYDPVANERAYLNNRRERQFGMSPRNTENIARVISNFHRVVKAVQVA